MELKLNPSEEETLRGFLGQYLDEAGEYYNEFIYDIYERMVKELDK